MERILFTLESKVFQHALQEHHTGRDVELVDQWGVQDRQIEHILRALEADLDAGSPAGKLFGQSLISALAVDLQRRYMSRRPNP